MVSDKPPQNGDQEERLNQIIDAISAMAALDFSKKLEVQSTNDLIDVIGFGLNMMSEALQNTVVSKSVLEKSERKYRALFSHSKSAIFILAPFKIVECNGMASTLLGWTNPELVGRPFQEFICHSDPSVDPAEAFGQVLKQAAHSPARSTRFQVIRSDQSTLDVEINLNILYLDETPLFQAIVDDITRQKKETQALRQAATQFRALFDHAPVGMALCSMQGEFVQVNRSFSALTGYTQEDLKNKNFLDLTHPDDVQLALTENQKLLDGKVDATSLEKRYICKSGEILHTLLTVSLLRDDESGEQFFVGQFVDISERRKAKLKIQEQVEELQRANRELDQFAHAVSHDLKAPLRGIATLVNFIEEDLPASELQSIQEKLQLIKGRIARMNNLINGILEYARIGRNEEIIEQVDVGAVIEEVLEMLPHPLNLQLELPERLPLLHTNRTGLTQIFQNLLSNAIKYNDKSVCNIRIRYQQIGTLHQFDIEDNGMGIKDAHKEKIFDIFQTLQPRDQLESTGVGLSIVKKRLETLGGSITLESIPGKGTTFSFTIPET